MKIIYLLSGQESDENFEAKVANYLKIDLVGKKSVCFIASSPDDYKENDYYGKVLGRWFSNLNVDINKFQIIDNRMTNDIIRDAINKSDIVFLFGGNPFTQIKFLNDSGVAEILRGFEGIIMGESAGAMNIGKTVFYSKDEDCPNTVTYDSLGLVDVTVSPHFDINNKDEVADIIEFSKKIKIIALPNESAIRISDTLTYIGDRYEVVDGKLVLSNK